MSHNICGYFFWIRGEARRCFEHWHLSSIIFFCYSFPIAFLWIREGTSEAAKIALSVLILLIGLLIYMKSTRLFLLSYCLTNTTMFPCFIVKPSVHFSEFLMTFVIIGSFSVVFVLTQDFPKKESDFANREYWKFIFLYWAIFYLNVFQKSAKEFEAIQIFFMLLLNFLFSFLILYLFKYNKESESDNEY